MTSTHVEKVQAHDGGEFDAFCAVPESGGGLGVILFQEIFGVNENMRGLAGRMADAGYLTLVPDMFWRQQRNLPVSSAAAPDGSCTTATSWNTRTRG